MTWVDLWLEVFAGPPVDPTSREVSVQEVLAVLITGTKADWFLPYAPTVAGDRFLRALWASAFGAAQDGAVEWFVSEYALPVPAEWRAEIPYTYRCPDFACCVGDRILVVELKTERGSYNRQQMADYLRLARRKHPHARLDVMLLGPIAPLYRPLRDDRQRYAELTWHGILPLLVEVFAPQQDGCEPSLVPGC